MTKSMSSLHQTEDGSNRQADDDGSFTIELMATVVVEFFVALMTITQNRLDIRRADDEPTSS